MSTLEKVVILVGAAYVAVPVIAIIHSAVALDSTELVALFFFFFLFLVIAIEVLELEVSG